MQRSIYLAKLIGPVMAAIGVGMLLNSAVFRILAQQFLSSYALIFLAGLITLFAGIALVLAHNVWTPDWRVIITILGWLGVIGGALRIIAPNLVVRIGGAVIGHAGAMFIFAGFALLALGCVLSYFGYAETSSPPARTNSRRGQRKRRAT
jgi:hypothetical protein